MIRQEILQLSTRGRGTYNITREVQAVAEGSGIATGLCHVFVHHTSASLILCENADPQVRHDLEAFLARLVPDGDPLFGHTQEGADDMPAHVRSILTNMDLSVPFQAGELLLGTWQGIYLWEHRHQPQRRRLVVHIGA